MSKRSSDEHGPAHGGARSAAAGMPQVVPGAVLGDEDAHELEAESIGRYLSQQRRLRGISIEQLAESTRIPRRSLERLESGHFDHDVDGFVRGFVRTVAAGLGLDPDDTLTRMLAEPQAHPDARGPIPAWLGRGLVGVVAMLLVVMAFGLVRAVWQAGGGGHAEKQVGSGVVVWRSDPVRALAEAHAARSDSSPTLPAGSRGATQAGRAGSTERAPLTGRAGATGAESQAGRAGATAGESPTGLAGASAGASPTGLAGTTAGQSPTGLAGTTAGQSPGREPAAE